MSCDLTATDELTGNSLQVTGVASIMWPGAFAVGCNGRFGNIYIGDGVRNQPYKPPPPPPMQVWRALSNRVPHFHPDLRQCVRLFDVSSLRVFPHCFLPSTRVPTRRRSTTPRSSKRTLSCPRSRRIRSPRSLQRARRGQRSRLKRSRRAGARRSGVWGSRSGGLSGTPQQQANNLYIISCRPQSVVSLSARSLGQKYRPSFRLRCFVPPSSCRLWWHVPCTLLRLSSPAGSRAARP